MPLLLLNTSERAYVLTRDHEETQAFNSLSVVSGYSQTEHNGADSCGTEPQSQVQGCSPLHHTRLTEHPRQGEGVGWCLRDARKLGLLQIPQEGVGLLAGLWLEQALPKAVSKANL